MTLEADQKITEREKQIVQELVGLPDSTEIEINDDGWTSRVYIIRRGEFVIKFPRREEVKDEYAQEIEILRLLEGIRSPVQVPKLRWTHPDLEYLGYEGIVGRAFDSAAKDVAPAVKAQIGKSIGKFLKELHSLHFNGGLDMSIEDEIKQFQQKYEAGQSVYRHELNPQEQAKLKNLVEYQLPDELHKLGINRVVCHGDLGYWNMVLKDDHTIGFIDFGDIGHYDESKDFIGLEDQEVLDAALSVYGDSKLLRRKVKARMKVLDLLDLPYFIEKGNEASIARTIQKIKATL